MEYKKPLPKISADTRPFWEGCKAHEIRIQKCGECGTLRWPPAFVCPRCLSQKTDWAVASGKGTVYSYVIYHVAYDPAFQGDLPYVVALVALEEGPHLLTNIVGCDPHAVTCDMAVEVVWEDATDAFSIPRFRPCGKGQP